MAQKPDSFQCGPFEVARNPDVRTFVDKLNRLREAVDSCRLQPGVGYTFSRSANGTVLNIQPRTGGGGTEDVFPFQVTFTIRDEEVFFRVHPESGTVGNLEVERLGEEISTGQPDLDTSIRIILSADVSPGPVITRLYLRSQPVDEDFFDFEPGQLDELAPQTRANIILATLSKEGVVQNVRTHLTYTLGSSNGFPALYFLRM